MESPVRFSSSRGVAFEVKPRRDHFAIETPFKPSRLQPDPDSRRPSYSFFDLNHEDDEEEEDGLEFSNQLAEDLEKQTRSPIIHLLALASNLEQQPPKAARKPSSLSIIFLKQERFTVYKLLFAVCLVLNITALVLAATWKFPYARKRATLFSVANILSLTLCRSEAFLRVVFWMAVNLLGWSWIPLFVKTATTSLLQSLGGIHSGCGVSSIAWLVYALVLTLKDRQNSSLEIIGVALAILGLLCLSSLAALPPVRDLHHNVFERAHRFAGWTALVLLWAFIILTVSYNPATGSYSNDLKSSLFRQQEFWFTLAITLHIVVPWLSVRRVAVKVSSPSKEASIIKFSGGVKAGLFGRISRSPFSDWHAFGIISDGKSEHMMLAGAVGDFTESLVSEPPSHLWVRQVHFAGLPYLVNMYDRVLCVATSTGVGAFLSFLLQESSAEVCIIWIARGIEQNFGREIKEMTSSSGRAKVIVHDSAVAGRADIPKMSVKVAREWGAEVVIVTSKPEVSRDVVNACKSANIPAFGPIWDS